MRRWGVDANVATPLCKNMHARVVVLVEDLGATWGPGFLRYSYLLQPVAANFSSIRRLLVCTSLLLGFFQTMDYMPHFTLYTPVPLGYALLYSSSGHV